MFFAYLIVLLTSSKVLSLGKTKEKGIFLLFFTRLIVLLLAKLVFFMETAKTKLVKSYRRYLKLQKNVTQNTLDAYMHDLEKLLNWLEQEGVSPESVTLEHLQQFAASLHDIGIGPRSQCRILSGIRAFYRFMLMDGYRDDDPTELLESPQIGEHLPEVLSTAEVDQ